MTRSLADLLTPAEPAASDRIYGIVTAVVTRVNDDDNLGRVKVKFPWLSEQDESPWIQFAAPGAGADRGAFFVPEPNDHVIVAFEHGDVGAPVVIGTLWTQNTKPPESQYRDARDEKITKRTIKSRSGHVVRLDDTEGREKIEILGRDGQTSVVVDAARHTVEIRAGADISIAAEGKLTLSGNGVEIKSQAGAKVEATQGMDLKAGGRLNVKGSTVNVN